MRLKDRLIKLKYTLDLKKLQVVIPKNKKKVAAKLKLKKDRQSVAAASGLIGKQMETHLKEYIDWHPFKNAFANNIDFILIDDEALDIDFMKVNQAIEIFKSRKPIIFFLKKLPSQTSYEHTLQYAHKIYLCKNIEIQGTPFENVGDKIEVVDYYVDMKKNSPKNRAASAGRIGIVIDDYSIEQESFEELIAALKKWSFREDLQIICFKGKALSYLSDKPDLVSRISGICTDVNEANQNFDAVLLINLTKDKINDFELSKRLSRGQLAINAYSNNKAYYFDNVLTGVSENLINYIEGLQRHFSLEEISVNCIRKVARSQSQKVHLKRIAQAESQRNIKSHGISIVACTSKPTFLNNIIENYHRQIYEDKELIIVLHSNKLDIEALRAKITDPNIKVYQRNPNAISFGYCLNYGVALSNKEYVAKFDDDDYYGEEYLSDLMDAFSYSDAKVVGKLSFHSYLHGSNKFVTRKPGNEYKYTSFLPGATFLIKREVFEKNMFRDIPRDIDGRFCFDCHANKIKLYSVDSFNLLVNRLSDKGIHTWKASDQLIIRQSLPANDSIDEELLHNSAYLLSNNRSSTFTDAIKSICV
ncbi:hypothetical protein YSY43_43550 [Paenibacillus sp. YSY-4.3]